MRTILLAAALVVILMVGCKRVETGEVGLRIGFDKQVAPGELAAGSFNQILVGEVLTFPVREIKVAVEDKRPITKDNSTMSDFDFIVIYNINPTAVSELWTTKSKGFHVKDEHGDWVLMFSYMETIATSALYKAVRAYNALEINDKRGLLEQEIKGFMMTALTEEKLNTSLIVTQTQIKNAVIDPMITKSANDVITAQNEQNSKKIEVGTAQLEAQRIAALNSNAKAIDYMNAQAQLEIAKGIANGKVNTIVVPYDFKGMVNIGPPLK